MSETDLYRVTGPSRWADPPVWYSYSSLVRIQRCPLEFQLLRSEYPGFPRFPARPNPASVEGRIVHAVMERLLRALGRYGFPPLGSPEFRKVVSSVSVESAVRESLSEHAARVEAHPRGGGFRMRSGPDQIVNRVVRLCRDQYDVLRGSFPERMDVACSAHDHPSKLGGVAGVGSLLSAVGVLAEVSLEHPELPFRGVLDLVYQDGEAAVVADFKTGTEHDGHAEQVGWYAVLWWRATGEPPARAEILYRGSKGTVLTDKVLLRQAERDLGSRIEQASLSLSELPAQAHPGEHCRWCDVRQFCDAYWVNRGAMGEAKRQKAESVDIELTVVSPASEHGVVARSSNGEEVSVVFERGLARLHGPFAVGERLRVIRGERGAEVETVELKPWTEVFHRLA